MQPKDEGPAPRLSPYAEQLSGRTKTVVNVREGYQTPWHAHDCDMLFVPVAGRFDVIGPDGEPLTSGPGEFSWFAAGEGHATTAQTLRQTHLAIYVDPDFWSLVLRAQGIERPQQGMRSGSVAMNMLSQKLLQTSLEGADSEANAVYCGALIMEAARLSANPVLHERGTPARMVAQLLTDFIDADLARPLSLDAFAEKHRLSRRQVERQFRSAFGMSPLEFQQARRVERARYLLQTTSDSVLSIAQQVGWESGSYLSRVLRKTWARTAAELRTLENPD
ncbi:AraC family transcriptional regulator [Variovorax rhizosphaerae]|uniref:AraC family transcriptional regulator n=1 Tax=Variovorax rhizosphaerae TaxID=1836200 RepID=A0ABU8WK52_9BURK